MAKHKKSKAKSASELLSDVTTRHKKETITLFDLVGGFEQRSFSLCLMVFCAPTVLPFSPPGFTAMVATPLAFFAIQMLMGRETLWLPNWIGKKQIKMSSLKAVVKRINPWLKRMEVLLKPRLLFLTGRVGEKFVGLCCLLCACSVAMPLPFTNTIPSIGIFLMALGLLERDGLMIKGGVLVGALGIGITTTIILLGKEAVEGIFSTIKSLIF